MEFLSKLWKTQTKLGKFNIINVFLLMLYFVTIGWKPYWLISPWSSLTFFIGIYNVVKVFKNSITDRRTDTWKH